MSRTARVFAAMLVAVALALIELPLSSEGPTPGLAAGPEIGPSGGVTRQDSSSRTRPVSRRSVALAMVRRAPEKSRGGARTGLSSTTGPTPDGDSSSSRPPSTLFGFFPGRQSDDPTASFSVKNSFTQISQTLGTPDVARVFFPGLPPAGFTGSSADLGVPVVVSFKADPAAVAAGSYDTQIQSFFNSIPTDLTVWWSYYHEPEDNIEKGEFTAAQYRAAWNHLHQLVPHRTTLRPTLILMRWSLQVPTRHIDDYLTPGLDVLAWDAYVTPNTPTVADAYDPAKAVSDSYGLGFAVAETSLRATMTNPPSYNTVVRDIVDHATTTNAEFVTWFETNKNDGDWRLTPHTTAANLWNQLTHN